MFQRRKETFRDGIIVAVAFPTHALDGPVRGQGRTILQIGILTAAVGVLQ